MQSSPPTPDKERLQDLQLRHMTRADLPIVLDFFEQLNPLATREQIAKWTTPLLTEHPFLCWVAVQGDEVIGAITAGFRHEMPFIEDFFVDIPYRGQGIGHQLLSTVLEQFRHMKVPFVKVEINPSTWPLAQKFYYQHGFRVCGSEQDRFGLGPQGDSVVLKKLFQL